MPGFGERVLRFEVGDRVGIVAVDEPVPLVHRLVAVHSTNMRHPLRDRRCLCVDPWQSQPRRRIRLGLDPGAPVDS